MPTFREQGFDFVAAASRGFVGPPGLPAAIRHRLEAAFAAALAEPGFLADAERLAMPLRPLVGGAYASMIAEMDASLARAVAAPPLEGIGMVTRRGVKADRGREP